VSGLAATLARRRRRISPRRTLRGVLAGVPPRWRRRLVVALALVLVLAGLYQLWLRNSSFVGVDDVTVTGLTTEDAERVRSALSAAGQSMTTLNVDHEKLERAVAAYPVVRELEVTADFPHGLKVHVVEHHPAAIVVSDSGRMPVAGDGTILRGLAVEGKLPTVDADGALGTERVRDPEARAAVAVAGAAPAILRSRVEEVTRRSDQGLVAELRDGPELIFGNARRLRAKWAAAARVLADLEARGASYIDLRIPSRPAAGGLPTATVTPVAPAGTVSTQPVDPTATDPSAATADPTAAATTPTDPATADPTTTTTDPGATDPSVATPQSTPPATDPSTTTTPQQQVPVAPVTGTSEGGATAAP
jgi:cell division protein FtsQ